MNDKLHQILDYIFDRMGEQTTWRGIAFFLALLGAKFGAQVDWGGAAALGGAVSGLMKILLPDPPRYVIPKA
jgi:hypothetical protein